MRSSACVCSVRIAAASFTCGGDETALTKAYALTLQAIVLVSAQLPNLANLDLLANPLHAVSGTPCF